MKDVICVVEQHLLIKTKLTLSLCYLHIFFCIHLDITWKSLLTNMTESLIIPASEQHTATVNV